MAAKFSCSVLLLLFLVDGIVVGVNSLSPSDASTIDFIRTSCNSTLYPSLCFTSLSPYADAVVGNSPVRLAHLAVNVTRARVRALSLHVSALRRGAPLPPREGMALRDCAETLDDAVALTWQSAQELGRVYLSPSAPETGLRVLNVQTWMSGALTDEETCADGFDRVGAASTTKADVCRRASLAKQYTSNALALVNCLVAG